MSKRKRGFYTEELYTAHCSKQKDNSPERPSNVEGYLKVSDEIIQMIGAGKSVVTPVTEESNLYFDLGYDSLAFIGLLLRIEKKYSIKFELAEMGSCLRAGSLIDLAKQKIKGH